MESAGQLLLGFRHVERRTVGFGEAADEKQDESDRLQKDEPVARVELRVDDAHHAQRAGGHDQADQRHRDRDLVADELRRRAQARKQRELAVRRPAAQDDAVHADRRDRHDVEQADVHIRDPQRHVPAKQMHDGPERDDRERNQRRHHDDDGRGGKHPFVGARGRDVFLQQQLHRVCNGLKSPVRADAHGPKTHLHPRDHLALEQHHIGDGHQSGVQNKQYLQKGNEVGVNH